MVPQLVLSKCLTKIYGRIIVSLKKNVIGRNKIKKDKIASITIVERPKFKGRKLKVVAVEEGYVVSSI